MSSGTKHAPRREGDEVWVHRLPKPRLVDDRIGWIADAVRGSTVAHLGYADIGCERSRAVDGTWLHGRLESSALRLVGLDLAPGSLSADAGATSETHEVDCTDPDAVASLGLGEFDWVVAGELIEHVDNPGGLLDATAQLCAPGGTLLISTPNARRLMDVVHAALGREILHPDHVALYSVRTLAVLLARHGWRVEETLVYLNPRPSARPGKLRHALLRLAYEAERALVRSVSPYLADGLVVLARR